MSRIGFALLCSSTLLVLSACSDKHDYDYNYDGPRPDPREGTLEITWSIAGRTDADVCDEVGAVAFHQNLYDEGYFVGQLEVPCADFAVTRQLYVDNFLARSTLIDVDRLSVMRRVVEDFFDIAEGQVTHLSMDFPSAAAVPMDPPPDAGAPSTDAGGEPPAPDAGQTTEADAAAPDAGS